MWTAKVIQLKEKPIMPSDIIDMEVEFMGDSNRKISKSYPIYLDTLATVDVTSIKETIKKDLDRLNKMDELKTFLANKYGKSIE